MSAAKSKKRKGKHRTGQKPLERLRETLASGPTQGMPIVVEPKGEVKMSEVLESFVDPYLDACETADDYRKLYNLAALAWNASFLPPLGQEEVIEEVLGGGLPANPKAELGAVVRALIARKQACSRIIRGKSSTSMWQKPAAGTTCLWRRRFDGA